MKFCKRWGTSQGAPWCSWTSTVCSGVPESLGLLWRRGVLNACFGKVRPLKTRYLASAPSQIPDCWSFLWKKQSLWIFILVKKKKEVLHRILHPTESRKEQRNIVKKCVCIKFVKKLPWRVKKKKYNKHFLLKVILFIKRLFFFSLQKGNSLCIPSTSISHYTALL